MDAGRPDQPFHLQSQLEEWGRNKAAVLRLATQFLQLTLTSLWRPVAAVVLVTAGRSVPPAPPFLSFQCDTVDSCGPSFAANSFSTLASCFNHSGCFVSISNR